MSEQYRHPRESGGTVSVGSYPSGGGSQYAKPKLRSSQSNATSYLPGSKKIK
jgi:hypothetical protein